ncbi:nucleotidyl transferase AbiEii/AbiGii toxin family protein [Bacteroides sp. OttesenSCG-928-D19]|nr:nucleotidyl transferase AbiEii/AbiGii toxin family protein [Bacteroides sp. OttesenSCG-928-D19]
MNDEVLANFVLVGGTALSLQIGHRISVDLDLFSNIPFDEEELSSYLSSMYGLELDFISKRTIKGEIQGVQIDCLAHQYPWVSPLNNLEGIRLSGLPDIAAMKLNAISGNGTRIKDFIDVAYLSKYLSLSEMLEAYQKKYKANPVIAVKSIAFFNDINFKEPIQMADEKKFNWKQIERRIFDMQRNYDKVFNTFP